VARQVRNLVYISAEITNSKGALGRRTLATNGTQELCNEGEAVYFLMNQEKAKEMGFLLRNTESNKGGLDNEDYTYRSHRICWRRYAA